ncbi:MAG: COX15/CtaA family protein [Burkholderiaceae bacterium]|nr:COX15/CtaA family protein [Burkholderiaceae bacterium]
MTDCLLPSKTWRWMAWACLLLLLLVTVLSAFLRHRAEGLGCQPWPGCLAAGTAASGVVEALARGAHRVAATAVLGLAIGLLVLALRARPSLRREAGLSALLLLMALLLAWLGVHTTGSRAPAVALGNLLGGFLMVSIAARLLAPPDRRGLGPVALGVALLLVAQAAGGALVSASHAGLACDALRGCADQAAAAGWPWAALKPWVGAGLLPGDGALLQLLHRAGAWVTAPALAALGLLALRRGRRAEGAALLALLAAVLALGLVLGSSGLPLAAVLLHNLGSALLLAAVVRLV